MVTGAISRTERIAATLGVDGRSYLVSALPGSLRSVASGLVVVAGDLRSLDDTLGWPPGRILVLRDPAADRDRLDGLVRRADLSAFCGLVVVADESTAPDQLHPAPCRVPMVLVTGASARDRVSYAVRITIDVRPQPATVAAVPAPRSGRVRRCELPAPSPVPGIVGRAARVHQH